MPQQAHRWRRERIEGARDWQYGQQRDHQQYSVQSRARELRKRRAAVWGGASIIRVSRDKHMTQIPHRDTLALFALLTAKCSRGGVLRECLNAHEIYRNNSYSN
jgi:hypothetical protein